MNKERLEQMVTMLRTVPKERFNIAFWDCGTAACAVGHACLNPVFQAQGLTIAETGFGDFVPHVKDGGGHIRRSWDAVNTFFGINDETSTHLFCGHAYQSATADADDVEVTPDMVADRIVELLSEA